MKSKTSTKTTAKSKPTTKEKAKAKAPVKKVAKAVKKVLPVHTKIEKPQVKEVDKSLEPVVTQVLNITPPQPSTMPLQPSCPKIVCTCGTMYMKLVKDGPHRTWRCQKCGTEFTEF